ncbi:MAG: hypothetical protein CBC34_020220 [Hyphomicrobiaceae bacterium TMED74]|nr:hypothetical protein [Filomicrobium sp.]RPG36149.1 MAG: hypothetical protein CBC34_020220 [Hyphomicrobiaceae bacterium TMED74]
MHSPKLVRPLDVVGSEDAISSCHAITAEPAIAVSASPAGTARAMKDTQPVRYMDAIRLRYQQLGYDPYRWFEAGYAPSLTPMPKKLSESRIGMLATSGAYVAGQVAYYYKDDTSLREIPKSTADEDLRFTHITENYLGSSRKDPNSTFPLSALKALEADGHIGELAHDVYSCMGGIYSQRRVREELIPAVEERFKAQNVDAVLLVPM